MKIPLHRIAFIVKYHRVLFTSVSNLIPATYMHKSTCLFGDYIINWTDKRTVIKRGKI